MKKNNDIKKWGLIILMAAIAYLIVNNLSILTNVFNTVVKVLIPFIIGGIIAFILNIPMVKIEKKLQAKFGKKGSKFPVRIVSIILSLLLFLGVFAIVLFLLIPELVENLQLLAVNIPKFFDNAQKWIIDLLDKYPDIQIRLEETFVKTGDIDTIVTNILNYLLTGTVGFITNFVSSVITLFTAIIFSIYMLSSKEYLIRGFKKLIYAFSKKEYANKIINVSRLANKTFNKFISGQCLEAVILGCLIFISLIIFRFPYALIISVLTALTALIPIFGAIIAMIVGVVLIGISNPIQAILFIVVFQVVQQIEGNFIYPKVVGKSVGLSPMWTLLAITVGGSLFGIVGMLIALPLASVIYAILKEVTNTKLKEKNIKII